MPRRHIIVSGRVQGVGFRYHARLLAETYRLTGWVKNLASGDVELELQGSEVNLSEFLLNIGRRSFLIRIDEMTLKELDEIQEDEFTIRE